MNNNIKIFIGGCGRSGTTYLRMILDTHKDIYIPMESLFLIDYLEYEKYIPLRLLRYFFFKEPFLKTWYKGLSLKGDNMREIIDKVHLETAKENGAIIWGQKTPRFIRYVNLFNNNFKNIKWIFIYRDPRAVVSSMLKAKDHTFSIYKACKRWIRDNQLLINYMKNKGNNNNYYFIKYETLIEDFENEINKLFDYLNLSDINIQQIVERDHIPNELISGNSAFANCIREGLAPNKKSTENWKKHLKEKHIRYVETVCREQMKVLGYIPLINKNERKLKLRLMFLHNLKDYLYIINNMRYFPSHAFFTIIKKCVFKILLIRKYV